MALDPDGVDTVTFDSFGTLVDVDSTASVVEEYVDSPVRFARAWHTRAANYGMISNFFDAYETYYELHRLALEYMLAERGISVSDEELAEMTDVYHEMDAFDDVRPAMEALHDAGYNLGIVSNGDPPMLDSLVRVTDVDEFLTATVSADEIERHKPAVGLYEHAADRLDARPSNVVHTSYGQVDVQGAINAGMGGVWIDRQDSQPETFGPEPDLEIDSLDELVDRLT